MQIGNQTWLAENLDFKFSGLVIGQDISYSDPRANYYDNAESVYGVNGNRYGLLYNGYAIKYLNDNKSQLIPGWHVATYQEWTDLVSEFGGNIVAGNKLKSTTGWESGNGDGSSGFDAYPAGTYGTGGFNGVGNNATFWTSTPTGTFMYSFTLSTSSGVGTTYNSKFNCFSVRLVKDA